MAGGHGGSRSGPTCRRWGTGSTGCSAGGGRRRRHVRVRQWIAVVSDPSTGVEVSTTASSLAVIDRGSGRLVELSRGAPSSSIRTGRTPSAFIDDPDGARNHGVRWWATKAPSCSRSCGPQDARCGRRCGALGVGDVGGCGSSNVLDAALFCGSTCGRGIHWQESLTALKICSESGRTARRRPTRCRTGIWTTDETGTVPRTTPGVDVSGGGPGSSRPGSSRSVPGWRCGNDGKYSFAVRAGGRNENERPVLACGRPVPPTHGTTRTCCPRPSRRTVSTRSSDVGPCNRSLLVGPARRRLAGSGGRQGRAPVGTRSRPSWSTPSTRVSWAGRVRSGASPGRVSW